MPKLKDFFTTLKEQGKINNADYDKWVESIPDGEIPDHVVKSFEDSFLTIDRAISHPKVHGRIRSDVLSPIDVYMASVIEAVNGVDKMSAVELEGIIRESGDGKKIPDTYKQFDSFTKKLPGIFNKIKAAPAMDEDAKKKLAEYEKNIQDMTDKFTKAEKDYNDKLKQQQEASEKEFHDFRLDSELQNLGNKFTLAEAYETTRPSITKFIMSEIKAGNALKLGENNGQPVIHVLDETGKPKFNGNSPVTIDNLLAEKYQPFLKQSEGGRSQEIPKNQQQSQKPTVRAGARTTVV
jgi:hypothetical protein